MGQVRRIGMDTRAMLARVAASGAMLPEPQPAPPRDRVADAALERLERAQIARRRAESAGCPVRHLTSILGHPRRSEALTTIWAYLRSDAWALLMLGAPGTGKTWAAAYAALRSPDPLWLTASRMMRVGMYDDERWGRITSAHLVVLDDLGVEYQDKSGSMSQRLDALVDERYSADRKLIITSNLSKQAFKTRYGERIVDRLRDQGRVAVISGGSMRGRA